MNFIIMQGTTLAGKTEHGRKLAKRHNYAYVSSGDIARSLMDADTKKLFADGQLSPHDEQIRKTIYDIIKIEFDKNTPGIVLDGFPRTAAHVIDFIIWMADKGPVPQQIVVARLDVAQDVIIARAKARSRDEFDTTAIVMKRDAVYCAETKPALDYLGRMCNQVVVTVHSEAEAENVYRALEGELEDRRLL